MEVRAELGIDQSELAEEARLKQPTISKIENGHRVSEHSALQVFYAVNRLRAARGWSALEFDEIRWNLRHTHEGDDE